MKRKRGKNSRRRGNVIDVEALSEIRNLLGGMPRRRDLLIEYLHLIQDHYKHVSKRHIQALAEELKL
ncbi:MAG: NADH-quinone oxidoreductase subunit F, partial [Gammaproteobacteria bacterium]